MTESRQPFFAGCGTWLLAGIALLWSFLSLMARADRPEEVNAAPYIDWFTTAPLWAFLVWLCARHADKERGISKHKAVVAAVLAYLVAGLAFSSWQVLKIRMRMAGMEKAREHGARMEQEASNQASQAIGAPGAPQPER